MGKEGKYDLKLVDQPAAGSDSDSETDSEDGETAEVGFRADPAAQPSRKNLFEFNSRLTAPCPVFFSNRRGVTVFL